MIDPDRILGGLLGVAIGDALGVPFEFSGRDSIAADPVSGMRGYRTWNQPPGTWSDDTALTLCAAESLVGGFDLTDMGSRFVRWLYENYWTARGDVFDVGDTTSIAIRALSRGVGPLIAGGADARSNGNGLLMRILPVALRYPLETFDSLVMKANQASCLTHAHPRSQVACGLYVMFAQGLLQGVAPSAALAAMREGAERLYSGAPYAAELSEFDRLVADRFGETDRDEIDAGGYVVAALEAAMWSFLTTETYRDCVFTAVNLGGDTDTVAAIASGLAGVYYGASAIPREWLDTLARSDDIEELGRRLTDVVCAEIGCA